MINDKAMEIHEDLIQSLNVLYKKSRENTDDKLVEHCGYSLMIVILQTLSGLTVEELQSVPELFLQFSKYSYNLLMAGIKDDEHVSKLELGTTMKQISETLEEVNPENKNVRSLENKMLLALNKAYN